MRRNDYVSIILMHPYYSKKFNNSTEFILFPSSFGVCLDRNKKWLFYEIDERERVDEKVFSSEREAFEFAFRKYGLKIPAKQRPIKSNVPEFKILAPNGHTIIGGRFVAATRVYARTARAHGCKKQAVASLKIKRKSSSAKKYSLKRKNSD